MGHLYVTQRKTKRVKSKASSSSVELQCTWLELRYVPRAVPRGWCCYWEVQTRWRQAEARCYLALWHAFFVSGWGCGGVTARRWASLVKRDSDSVGWMNADWLATLNQHWACRHPCSESLDQIEDGQGVSGRHDAAYARYIEYRLIAVMSRRNDYRMNSFWRICVTSDADANQMIEDGGLVAPDELFAKLRPKHGILLAKWEESELVGKVLAFGVVHSVNIPEKSTEVSWHRSDVILKPNPGGRQFWRSKLFFKFAKDVSIRYMLDDLFAEHFPELEEMEFGETKTIPRTSSNTAYQEIPGYVYLIESDHGYKIGKTINIKSRTRLFEVKLPFPISLINYSWFANYSKAERDLHKKFSEKRCEGEWFNL